MDRKSSLDLREEARARVLLAHRRGKAARPPPKPLGLAASRFVRSKVKGRVPALLNLKDRWREIAGEDIWNVCRPEKLSKGKAGRSLVLRVLPAAALWIQHEAETIRQRVSVAAGGDITEIQLIQGVLSDSRAAPARRVRPLTAGERQGLERQVAAIEPPGLRAAIVALGAAMLTADDPDPAPSPKEP